MSVACPGDAAIASDVELLGDAGLFLRTVLDPLHVATDDPSGSAARLLSSINNKLPSEPQLSSLLPPAWASVCLAVEPVTRTLLAARLRSGEPPLLAAVSLQQPSSTGGDDILRSAVAELQSIISSKEFSSRKKNKAASDNYH